MLMICRDQGNSSGIVHSVDIHPSRKHTCLVSCLILTLLLPCNEVGSHVSPSVKIRICTKLYL